MPTKQKSPFIAGIHFCSLFLVCLFLNFTCDVFGKEHRLVNVSASSMVTASSEYVDWRSPVCVTYKQTGQRSLWMSARSKEDQWLMLEFKKAILVEQIVITPDLHNPKNTLELGKCEYLGQDSQWHTLSVSEESSNSKIHLTCSPTKLTKLRVWFKNTRGGVVFVTEIQVLVAASDKAAAKGSRHLKDSEYANLSGFSKVSASSQLTEVYSPALVTDNQIATASRWLSARSKEDQWLMLEFKKAILLEQLVIVPDFSKPAFKWELGKCEYMDENSQWQTLSVTEKWLYSQLHMVFSPTKLTKLRVWFKNAQDGIVRVHEIKTNVNIRRYARQLSMQQVEVVKNRRNRVLSFDMDVVKKDLKDSIQGVDAEGHACGINYQTLLGDMEPEFSKLIQDSGRPVLRMSDRSRYSWRGPEVTDILVNKPSRKSAGHWFSPKQLHEFCRKNNVKLIGMFDTQYAYNEATGKRVQIYSHPENFEIGVKENMRKLKWVIDNGYLDLYVAWEIGNENYSKWYNTPRQYAEYSVMLATAAKKLDPEIRLAVSMVAAAPDDPNLEVVHTGQHARMWTEEFLEALGNDAKDFYYMIIHLYGGGFTYSANYFGIEKNSDLLDKYPATKHMRFIITEWRHTGGADRKHRQFNTAALWKAKFTLSMAAHPRVDYTGVHEFLTWSGVGYFSDGEWWRVQGRNKYKCTKTEELYRCNSGGKPTLEIGIFAQVLKLSNKIIRNYPLLLEHKADFGKNSSVLFSTIEDKQSLSESMLETRRDLEWFICTDRTKRKLGCLIVNTQAFPVNVTLKENNGKIWKVSHADALTCDFDKIYNFEIPGQKKYWQLAPVKPNPDGTVTIPAFSVVSLEAKAIMSRAK